MQSKQEIIIRALVRLGVNPPDQTPTANQSTAVDDVLVSMHEEWVDRGYVRWELSNIPLSLGDALTSVLAFSMANDYSIPDSRYQRLSIASAAGMRKILAYNEIPYSGTTEIQDL